MTDPDLHHPDPDPSKDLGIRLAPFRVLLQPYVDRVVESFFSAGNLQLEDRRDFGLVRTADAVVNRLILPDHMPLPVVYASLIFRPHVPLEEGVQRWLVDSLFPEHVFAPLARRFVADDSLDDVMRAGVTSSDVLIQTIRDEIYPDDAVIIFQAYIPELAGLDVSATAEVLEELPELHLGGLLEVSIYR